MKLRKFSLENSLLMLNSFNKSTFSKVVYENIVWPVSNLLDLMILTEYDKLVNKSSVHLSFIRKFLWFLKIVLALITQNEAEGSSSMTFFGQSFVLDREALSG